MSENEANLSTTGLDALLKSGRFKVMGRKKSKSKAITISSTGVITYNTPLKGSLYKAGRQVSIQVNPEANQLLIIAGEDIADANGVVGQTNPAVSAINVFREAELEYGVKILPNGIKTLSYRYEESDGGLEIIQEDEETLAVILNLSQRNRNAKVVVESVTGAELTEEEKKQLSK